MFLPSDKSRKGIRFGKYLLLSPLGRGGMSQVWLAIRYIGDEERTCVLKMTLDLVGLDAFRRQGLLTELRVGVRLRNSHILQIIDAGEYGGVAYIEFEFVDGVDLSQLLAVMQDRRAQVSIPLAVYIIRGVLEALYFAHERHQIGGVPEVVIHRDLTPDNVIVSSAGEVKVMDFGIGKLARDKATGQFVKGKWRYMPPEQTRGETTVETDLFYVGAILYELLEGVRFRDRIAPSDMDVAAARGEIPSLTRADVPPELVRLYYGLVVKDPVERVRSASLAIQMLKQWPGVPADADDMRTAYQRYGRPEVHSGYTRKDFEYPAEIERLMRAVLAAGGQDAPVVAAEMEPDAPRARQSPPTPSEPLRTTADAPMPVHLGIGADARRGAASVSAAPGHIPEPEPERGEGTLRFGTPFVTPPPEVTALLPPALAGPPPQPSRVEPAVITDQLHPSFAREPGTAAEPARPPEGAVEQADRRHETRASSPDVESSHTAGDPLVAEWGPRAPHTEGTAFAVVPDRRPRLLAVFVGMAAMVGLVVVGFIVNSGHGATTPSPPAVVVAEPVPASETSPAELEEPVLEPVRPSAERPATSTIVALPVVEPSAALVAARSEPPSPANPLEPELAPTEPAPVVASHVPESTLASTTTPKPVLARPRPKAPPKPEVEIRFAPMAAEGELRIGKKKLLTVERTFDTSMRVGKYALAWRLKGEQQWTTAEQLVLEDGRLYLVRLGPKGPRVSSQAVQP